MRRFNRVHDDVELSEIKKPRFNNDEKKYSTKYFSQYLKLGRASTTNVIPANTAGSLVPLEDNEPWKKWIFDPGSDVMIKWNRVFLITGMIALFIDPMYFYLFSIENDNKISCVKKMDWHLNVALTIFRTISDAFYVLHILFKFRTAFIAPSSRVFGRGELVTDIKQIAKRYLKTEFVIDLSAALPLPQIVAWLMIPGVKHLHPHQNNNTLSLVVLIQYFVRLYRIFPLSQQIINTAGVVTNTAWAGAAYNLLLYMIVSNVIGASYYLLTIVRQTTCWKSACRLENGTSGPPCKMEFLECDFLSAIDQTWANSTRVFANCNASDDSISFNFGIYQNALTTGAVSTSFFRKYFYSLWWGLQSLCTFGQGLSPSTYIWETAFSSLIVLLGLILFAHLISNMETYLQSLTARLEEWRLRRRDTEQWMVHRQLPQELRDRIRRFVQYKWFATQGVDDDSLLQALPADLRRDIQRHLCLDLVRRVPFFSQMDDPLLDAICDHLVSSLNTEGSYIVREGDPVTEMLFVIRGKLESSTTNGGQTGFFNSIILRPGDFCGEELLSWALLSKPATSLPYSTRTVQALVEVEAFALRAEDLSSVAAQFRRLHSKKLQHTFRYYSHHWRTWAACFIQAAWRRYKRKMQKSISRIESLSFRAERLAAHEFNSSHTEQITGEMMWDFAFAASTSRSSQGCKGGADISKLRKPDEPDFSADGDQFRETAIRPRFPSFGSACCIRTYQRRTPSIPLWRRFAARKVSAHDESCRAVRFVDSGTVVLTASPDCSILATDVETGRVIARLEEAHEDSINRLVTLTETTIASGDDEGCIKVWDTRNRSCCNSFEAHEDFISDMTFMSGTRQLLATSGDGSLSVCSLRKNKVQARSEFSEDELLSLVTMKGGKKVVCGSQNGPLLLYSWGHFEDCSDRLLGHPMSVDALLKLDEDTLISGSEDGVIRLVGILPNRIIRPLAEHSEYPIESLAFSHDRKFLGSISHDQMLKLWGIEELLIDSCQNMPIIQRAEADDDSDDDSDGMDLDPPPFQHSKGSRKNSNDRSSISSNANFFADL